jgi:hypothetical protein
LSIHSRVQEEELENALCDFILYLNIKDVRTDKDMKFMCDLRVHDSCHIRQNEYRPEYR